MSGDLIERLRKATVRSYLSRPGTDRPDWGQRGPCPGWDEVSVPIRASVELRGEGWALSQCGRCDWWSDDPVGCVIRTRHDRLWRNAQGTIVRP